MFVLTFTLLSEVILRVCCPRHIEPKEKEVCLFYLFNSPPPSFIFINNFIFLNRWIAQIRINAGSFGKIIFASL